MPNKKRILIVGGGYAGVSVAKTLEKKYRKNDDREIVLVDKNPFHTLLTELHEVAGLRTEPDAVQVPFRKIFGGTKVRVIVDTVKSIDFDAKKVTLSTTEMDYDQIVIGTGAQPDFFGMDSVRDNSLTLWSYDDAVRIRRHLDDVWARASAEPDAAKRRKLLTFVVAGAGFTGIEMVGELLELRDTMCERYHIPKSEVRTLVIEAMPDILAMLAEPQRVKARKYLDKKNCEIMLGAPIVAAEPGLVKLKDGSVVEAETFIWTCGVSGCAFAGTLGFEAKRNRVLTDDPLKAPGKDGVWIGGDNLWFIENEKPLPQVVETAHQTGELIAHNIVATLEGGELKPFKSNYHGFMVSIGGKYGVADAGGIKTSGFFAMAMKHMINMYYLFTIAGINQVWEYFKHEFLDIAERRSIIGGMIEHKTRGYWLLPIRMWLGFSWVMEALNKIGEGWLQFDLGSKSGWMFSSGVAQATLNPVPPMDAVSEASEEVVETVADVAQSVAQDALKPVLDMTKNIFSVDGSVATWFRTTFMDGIFAKVPFELFQSMVVGTELLIGLALFGGAFTWIAAVVSIGMCLIFTLSGMFAWDQLWFVFAAVLCMGGAGRVLGLDYWIVRFAKKIWNGFGWVRRNHIYLDEPSK